MESRYHPGRAVVSAIANAIPFVVVPILVLRTLPDLMGQLLPPAVVNDLLTLEAIILPLGIGVTILAALTAFFGRGLAGRAAFGTGRQFAKLAWVYFVLTGGLISLSFLGFSFFVNFQRLLYILYAAILIGALYFVVEFFIYRRAYQMASYPTEYYAGGPY
ncbi:MAG: hypothetical protein ACE5I4_09830 [Thermoplasmata archaeon]